MVSDQVEQLGKVSMSLKDSVGGPLWFCDRDVQKSKNPQPPARFPHKGYPLLGCRSILAPLLTQTLQRPQGSKLGHGS